MKTFDILSVTLLLAAIVSAAVAEKPKSEAEKKAAEAALKARMTVQGICPVSGQKLGRHGAAVRVKIGKEEVFLCCKACAKGKVDPKHWATIHANLAKAQRICPVMEHDLPKDAKWTIVDGRIVYVCCPPCIKKIEAEPKKYIAKVDILYQEAIKQREKNAKKKS
jgi:hypothetical protein